MSQKEFPCALLITYDLKKPRQDYDDLYKAIKALGAWWHYLESTWIVTSTLTPSHAFDRLKPAVDDSDRVLIVDITGADYSGWFPEKAWEWLK